jgi:hypothetical protein
MNKLYCILICKIWKILQDLIHAGMAGWASGSAAGTWPGPVIPAQQVIKC